MMPNVPNSPESVFRGIQIYVNVSDSPEKDMRYYGIWFGMSVSPESDKYAVEMEDITLLVRVAPSLSELFGLHRPLCGKLCG